ncbi:MAG TPA: hypothetical protein VF957_23380 [Bradyrhizobium sp.]
MSDDDVTPLTLAEACAFCKMTRAQFNRHIRPHVTEKRFGGSNRAPTQFLLGDLRNAYRRIFGHTQPEAPAAAPNALDKRREVIARLNRRLAKKGLPPLVS